MTATENRIKTSHWVDEGLMDYAEAARYLCTTPRHIRELWAKRSLAAIKVGRHVRFGRADLDTFIISRRVEAVRWRDRTSSWGTDSPSRPIP
jgi:excisionase family DNA binding protein